MREGGVLAYVVSRHPGRMEGTHTLIDGRVGRESAGHRLANALRCIVLEVLIGEEMCFPLFRPFRTSSTMNRLTL